MKELVRITPSNVMITLTEPIVQSTNVLPGVRNKKGMAIIIAKRVIKNKVLK